MRTVTRRSANHGLHLFLTIVTLGLWAPVWLIVAVVGRREVTTVQTSQAVQQAWHQSHNAHQVVPVPVVQNQWNPYTQRWEQPRYYGR